MSDSGQEDIRETKDVQLRPAEPEVKSADSSEQEDGQQDVRRITIRALAAGTLFSGLFAFLTVYCENFTGGYGLNLTATQIAVMPYVLLFLTVILLNPVCRLLRFIRPFTAAEILTIFIMGSVSAGVSTYGMVSQAIPVMGNLFNPHWNTKQSQYSLYVEPFINEGYFLSEPGIREAAGVYRETFMELRQLKRIYGRASGAARTAAAVAELRAEKARAEQADMPSASKNARISRISEELRFAEKAAQQAAKGWEQHAAEYNRDEVVKDFPALIEKADAEHTAAAQVLQNLKQKAFDRVSTFRRGLPEEMRAFPGFVKMRGEDMTTYMRRVSRLVRGRQALGNVKNGRDKAVSAQTADSSLRAEIAGYLKQAAEDLEPAALTQDDTGLRTSLEQKSGDLETEWLSVTGELKDVSRERRTAPAEEFDRLDDRINELTALEKDLSAQRDEIKKEIEEIDRRLAVTGRVGSLVKRLKEYARTLEQGGGGTPERIAAELKEIMLLFPAVDASMKRFIIGEVPWSHWIRPLFRWCIIIVLTYIILMTFNLLIFRQWAHNEKLIYPLAKLPEMLAGSEEKDGVRTTAAAGVVPQIYRRGLFWAGFAIVSVVHGWNLICTTGLVPGLPRIKRIFYWDPYVEGSIFDGIRGAGKIDIFFVMLGLAFFIPANISFSLWLFFVLFLVQLLFMVWLGFGVNLGNFPSDWWDRMNFRHAEGGGALVIFAIMVLWKCRKYFLCGFRPGAIRDLEKGEQMELRISSLVFVIGSILLVLIIWLDMGASLFWTCFVYVIIMVVTIGLIRAVAEGGILGFQCWFGPFHLIRAFRGLFRWTRRLDFSNVFAPLLTYYSVLFLDIKAFIAPAMANSIKIRDDLRMSRFRFHISVICGIGAAMVISISVYLMMAYNKGADGMELWFNSQFPPGLYSRIIQMNKVVPHKTGAALGWFIFGMVVMILLLYGRRFWFWLPHPIGMIMLVNPLMGSYWFSIFLGWAAKSLVTKYGNKDTYRSFLCFFIGIILSEILWVALYFIVAFIMGVGRLELTLDRVA